MTLSKCYQQNKGKSVLIPGGGKGNDGQCVQWADVVMKDVYELPYIYTPGAIDFWTKFEELGLDKNFDKIKAGSAIERGDYLIYDARVGSKYGHIDVASRDGVVYDFWAYDSNWGGVKDPKTGYPILYEAHHNDKYNDYIVGYLRRKDDDMYQGKSAEWWAKDSAKWQKLAENRQKRILAADKALAVGK